MTPSPVLLRPGFFGKSTFVQMLKCFLVKTYAMVFVGSDCVYCD
ncbi:hypothetical protein [Ruminobacter sp. RM87]|nr:hypothetical protein [Ruminobacter sp. RM87]